MEEAKVHATKPLHSIYRRACVLAAFAESWLWVAAATVVLPAISDNDFK